jgi:signal transduction histidine kinase
MRHALNLNDYFIQFIFLVILIVTFGSVTALVLYYFEVPGPDPGQPLGAPVSYILYNNVLKAFLAVVVIHFFRRTFPKLPGNTYSRFLHYGILAITLYVANGLMQTILASLYGPPDLSMVIWSSGVPMIFRINMVVAALLVYYWSLQQERREVAEMNRKLELSTLRELKTRAELDALQSKVNPHFLYNSLNSIHTLIDQQPAKAKEMILQLSKLFRLSVNHHDRFFWPLGEELDLIETYLSIEKVRFGEKLQVDIDCDASLKHYSIPRFVLQPLVENAIKHGVSKIEGIGRILVSASDKGEWVELTVWDNGPSFREELQAGHGLRSLQERVRSFGEGSSLGISGTSPDKHVTLKLKKRESTNH